MNIQIQVVIDGDETTRRDIAHLERGTLSVDTFGLQLAEAKQLLTAAQSAMVEAQITVSVCRNLIAVRPVRAP